MADVHGGCKLGGTSSLVIEVFAELQFRTKIERIVLDCTALNPFSRSHLTAAQAGKQVSVLLDD
jgi:hypothetical protein